MQRILIAVACVALLLAGSVRAADPEPLPAPAAGLSLADLEAIALENNPTLAQAAAIVTASEGKALQAGLYPNPTVGYTSDQIGIEGTAGELQGAFVQQTIVTAGKLRLSRAKYQQEALEAELNATAQQLRVLNAVRLGYYRLLALDRVVALHRELLANAEESLRTHKEMHNTGQANQADVLLAEIEANQATIALKAEENRRRAAWEALRSLIGQPELAESPLAGSLEPAGDPLDWQASLDRLLHESPELQAAQAHVVHDQISVRREQAQPIPNVVIQAATGYNFETSNTVAGVQVGIDLPIFDKNQGTIKQVQADLARSVADVRRIELELRRRLAEVYSQYQTTWDSARLQRQSIVPKAKEAHAIMADMYQKRRAPWMSVVNLQRNLFAVQSEYTRTLLELRQAEVAIQGLLLSDGLAEPAAPTPGGHLEGTPKPR